MSGPERTESSDGSKYVPFRGEQWKGAEATPRRPDGPANIMPGGTAHTAGGEKLNDVTIGTAAATIQWRDWAALPTKPCVKDALLTGIGGGFGMAGLRMAMRAPVFSACNWAVGTFCLSSFSVYQYCQYQRAAEREGMKRAMEIMDRKAIERKQKEARVERARELRRQKKEEEDQEAFAKLKDGKDKSTNQNKPWYQLW